MYKNLIYILILLITNYITNSFLGNFFILLSSIIYSLVILSFKKDILNRLNIDKIKVNTVLLLILLSYITESFMKASPYLNDLVLINNISMILIFILRLNLIIANILLIYIFLKTRKKYLIFSMIGLLNGILIFLELGSNLIHILNLISIIIYSIFIYGEKK